MEKNKYHILVVDDDDKIKELIKQFLTEKDFIVSTASNAEEAKIILEKSNVSVIPANGMRDAAEIAVSKAKIKG